MSGNQFIRLTVEGVVQGVGFRPFLHRLAGKHSICGWVRNTSSGLEGILKGECRDLEGFLRELKSSPPPMASIDAVGAENISPPDTLLSSGDFTGFSILESRTGSGSTLVSPDIAMCPECEAELYTKTDRRYRYPFINCTNCGPRYTIIDALPYDRGRTVMNEFEMCTDCRREYQDIDDRRYHAQPDCCPCCGPQIFYTGQDGAAAKGDDALRASQELLSQGGILAVKGVGGIHLACSALNAPAVNRLRIRKHRAEKPLAVMCRSLDAVRKICRISAGEEKLLTSPARPIVLLAKKKPDSLKELSFSRRLGVMLSYSPLHALLLDGAYKGPDILVMTSANLSGCPVLTDNSQALQALSGIADGFLLHNRRIRNRCDDSLVSEWRGRAYFLRRSRGYAPLPLELAPEPDTEASPNKNPDAHSAAAQNEKAGTGPAAAQNERTGAGSAAAPDKRTGAHSAAAPDVRTDADGIFAFGAEQKASFALGKDSRIFLSPYIGDLKNAETFEHYTESLHTYEKLFRLKPTLYVCDLHPDYLSSQEACRAAAKDRLPLLKVQHHWAHMASCMADNALDCQCFGIIWDGTGLGTDGNIWGGEFLTGSLHSFDRTGSIRPVLLPGGDRAVTEIGRIALSLTQDAKITDLTLVPLPKEKCEMLSRLSAAGHSPSASSIGRLFDGVCALLLGRGEVDYEGEGAALTEALSPFETPEEAGPDTVGFLKDLSYPLSFYKEGSLRIFDTRPVITGIVEDIRQHRDRSRTALRFMASLACMALDQCTVLNPKRLPVVLSGGVFQNRFLLHGVVRLLEDAGFTVYTHHRVSSNDEGVSLGQLAVARKKRSMNHVLGNAYENQ